jgi:hypothetical protein
LVLGTEIADAGDGTQELDRGEKGLDMRVDLLIDLTMAASIALICCRSVSWPVTQSAHLIKNIK